jgi:hypothetical protein
VVNNSKDTGNNNPKGAKYATASGLTKVANFASNTPTQPGATRNTDQPALRFGFVCF